MKTVYCDWLNVGIEIHSSMEALTDEMTVQFPDGIRIDGLTAVTDYPDGKVYAIYINRKLQVKERDGVIVHEVSHLLDTLLADFGINDTETRAYMSEWLFKQIRTVVGGK